MAMINGILKLELWRHVRVLAGEGHLEVEWQRREVLVGGGKENGSVPTHEVFTLVERRCSHAGEWGSEEVAVLPGQKLDCLWHGGWLQVLRCVTVRCVRGRREEAEEAAFCDEENTTV